MRVIEMKHKNSICILVVGFFSLSVIFGLVCRIVSKPQIESPISASETEELIEETEYEKNCMAEETGLFILKDIDGHVTVISSKNPEESFDTGILTETLPPATQQQLSIGITFCTEADLYDFLESYSS